MTAATWPSTTYEEDRRLPVPTGPAEGWLTIGLVFLLVLPVAWSIEDARWVLGDGSLTDFLPWTIVGGAAVGMLGAKLGLGRWRTHLLGAVAAALAVPILAGAVLEPSGSIADWFQATSDASIQAALDLTIRNKTVTQQYGHFLLVLGLICWATGQFAGYATLGHRRPLGAVFVTGLVLLANMTVTVRDQLTYLVIFSLAALFVLVRLHADDERLGWLRRRIGDPATVTGLYLRGGSGFVLAAVLGSLFLTSVAASAPLAGAFRALDQRLVEVGQSIQRFLPFGGPGTRIHGDSFGGTASITGQWQTDNTPSLEIQVPVGDTKPYYWRAFAYDRFTLNGWTLGENTREDRLTGQPILEGTGDRVPDPAVRHPLSYLVRSVGYSGSAIFLPDAPATIDMGSQLTLVGDQRAFGGLEAGGSWQTYRATSLVPTEGGEAFTVSQLRAAGTQYPEDFDLERYTDVPQGALGAEAQKLLARIQQLADASGDAENPYDLAHEAEKLLRDPSEFVYDTNVTDLPCEGISAVECFARHRHGYCQYYASTMAILLRQAGVPTRVAEGYMPGDRDDRTGIETILRSNAHAWVEVYFPRFGWYRFDPTGGGLTNLLPLPTGRPVPTASPGESLGSAGGPAASPRGNRPLNESDPGAGTTTSPRSSSVPFIIVGLLLLLSVAGIAFLIYWRGPRRASPPDAVWSSLGRLAGRFGWAPRPTQTPFEYAQALGDVLPVARPELHVVANAKVEASYGRHVLDERGIAALREAYRRLRLQLLRLAFRRPGRPAGVRPGGFWRPRLRR